jgi:peptide deformylase
MAIRIIREKGDGVLAEQSRPVKRFDAGLVALVEDMFETMAHYNGIGLAAPQIGIPKQILVIDTQVEGQRIAMLNPVIMQADGNEIDIEGCLSIPGVYGEVERSRQVRVRYQGVTGETHEITAEGLFARAIQHEFDHLCGKLFDERVIRFVPLEELEQDEDATEA